MCVCVCVGGGGGGGGERVFKYSNILKISPPKTKSFQMKILIFFQVSAKNIAILTSTHSLYFEQK